MPSIQTYVFVGINILPGNDENGGDDCYFQEPESYLEYGNFATLLKEQRGGVLDREEVIIINSKNLDCISDYEELCNILKSTKDGTILTKPPV
ncbi:MAG: hypothetical protein GWO07_01075 [Candidatus Dadabacteria bacterium]|nr:hypothetical protein [Candidatus Dadabacteria bacterium]NIS07368.1 hypothetical protein [Candidatus Dadabacteria bacterium]NIY21006.1 hypothetical protein [Candidatus Dadabacteria bacterium]